MTESNASYAQLDFDELLNFSGNMADISASARAEVCQSLLKSEKVSPSTGVQLHLLVGRLYSDDCGDISNILSEVDAIPPNSLQDDRLRQLMRIHAEALIRMHQLSKKLGNLEQKQKTAQPVIVPKASSGAKKDEARLLREKLEAIRTMEKQLDETGNGN